MFSQIEINVTGCCTRTCSFCPRGNENTWFNISIMIKIVHELRDYNGLITFSGRGEPLLHVNLPSLIGYAKTTKATVEVITNGDLLDDKKVKGLERAGLDRLLISVYEEEKMDTFKDLTAKSNIVIILRERWHDRTFNNRGGAMNPLAVSLD
ncbi:hypothetical protein LCGC14_2217090, partial [marine sediment metagenome]